MTSKDVKTLEEYKSKCSWIQGYGPIAELAHHFKTSSILEVGVAYGYHAAYLLSELDGLDYQGIDPYTAGYDVGDSLAADVAELYGYNRIDVAQQQLAMDRLYRAVSMKLQEINSNAKLFRGNFLKFSATYPSEKFDLIYIDGDHTEDGVFTDVVHALKHVRAGSVICGDDIEWHSVQSGLSRASKHYGLNPKLYKSAKTGKVIWFLEC